ncbi:MAG: sulfotransferase domain-containing protein [Hyphomonas sp.]|nr:sulfotransferase domain-containing protein [Hyphomonas sp.]
MARRIDFIIAGVQKAGTTSLDAFLRQHPDICMAKKKEPHFFDKRPPTGIRWLDYWLYHRQFDWKAWRDGCLLGEATPIISWWNGALERVWAYNAGIKIIVLLRDPVERAWSHYRMDCRLGRETLPYPMAIRQERERARRALPAQDRERSYLARSYYAPQIRELRRLFPEDQLLFLRTEDLAADPQRDLATVCRFLDLPPRVFDVSQRHNAAPEAERMSPDDRDYLRRVFTHDAAETRALLGWDQGDWSV